ncbi:polyhydroxyalkanoic acid system family protein [Novosphingobium hassiacum]|nr:polyhydroxyalkanoic acid system family protein [Novosphingobium hassiacum]
MRMAIPHTLGREEARRRLRDKAGRAAEKADGMATVTTAFTDDDHMTMSVTAMGYTVDCHVEVAESELVVDVDIPASLGFAKRMIEGVIREKSGKLLT